MPRKRKTGRPKSLWSPEKDTWILHARQAQVTEDVLAKVMHGLYGYPNPVIGLSVADALLHMEKDLREVRKAAAKELRSMGRTWTEIGLVIGVSRQRACQIGHAA